jgi:hypothetical protein
MKNVLYVVHIPAMIIGFIAGTIWVGLNASFNFAVSFWVE